MGNASSVVKGEQGPVTQALGVLSGEKNRKGKSESSAIVDINITPEKQEILSESWNVLNANLDAVGMATFARMFETHPEALKHIIPNLTSRANLKEGLTENLDHWHSEKLRDHAQRIMGIVGQVVKLLERGDMTKIEKLLEDLGRKHYGFGVHVDILQLMGPHFTASIYPQLKDMWTDDFQDAWVTLFNLLIHHMRIGYNAAMLEKVKPSWLGYFD